MFPSWLILGSAMILMGIFNKQLLRLLGLRPVSEVLATPSLKHSSRTIERMGRWLVIILGVSFVVQGLGEVLPDELGYKISSVLLWLSILLLLAIFGVGIVSWKAK